MLLVLDCYVDPGGGAKNFTPAITGVEFRVARPAHEPLTVSARDVAGLVITGSAASVVAEAPDWVEPLLELIRDAASLDRPILGVCFGHQAIAQALLGPGWVRTNAVPRVGWHDVEVVAPDPLLRGLESGFRTFVSHIDEVLAPPGPLTGRGENSAPGAWSPRLLARTAGGENDGFRLGDAPIWGVQYHAEMGLDEARTLVHSRARKHPELDPEALLSGAIDARPVFHQMMGNFLTHL